MMLGPFRRVWRAGLIFVAVLWSLSASGQERSFTQARAELARGLRSADPDERTQAVYALDGFDSGPAAEALVRRVLSRDDRTQVLRAAIQILGSMESAEAAEVLAEEALSGPATRRSRVFEALAWGRREAGLPPLLESAWDADPMVRTSALLALAPYPGKRAEEALGAALVAPEWPVRSAAIHGLRHRMAKDSVPALIDRLRHEDGRLRGDLGAALVRLTGTRLPPSFPHWESWLASKEKGAEKDTIPPPPPAPEPRAKLAGIESHGRRIVYLLALNQSMNDEVGADLASAAPPDVAAIGGEDLAAWAEAKTKLDLARLWIAWSIRCLAPDVQFDIVTYGASPNAVFGKLVPASPEMRERALRRVLSLSASGNSNLHAGLRSVFTLVSKNPLDAESLLSGPDTVFFLGDGTSDYGEVKSAFRAFEEAESLNRFRQIQFHSVGVGGHDAAVMADIASMAPGGEVRSVP